MKKIYIYILLITYLFVQTNEIYAINGTKNVILQNTITNNTKLAELKTFLRDNKNAIDYIINNAYLKEKTQIKTNDLAKLSNILLNIENLENTKNIIKLTSSFLNIENKFETLKNTNISNITDEKRKQMILGLENDIDLLDRNLEKIGDYEENSKLRERIYNFKMSLVTKDVNTPNSRYEESAGTTLEVNLKNDKLESSNSTLIIANFEIKLLILLLILGPIGFIIYKKIIQVRIQKTKENYKIKTLQIIRNNDEYTIEFDGIYNKGIKVLASNKKEINNSLDAIVKYCNNTRGSNILDELSEINTKTPDLNEIGKTIYRLFLPENIRTQLKQQNGNLIIKTDEQEIPWEIMHDEENYLSLKFPIARNIMTRENIRKNAKTQNKKPKILFIVNPTCDLDGAEIETQEIIKEIGNKAEIIVLKGENIDSIKLFSYFSKENIDIIHYSGHAYFNKENPDESGLILKNNLIVSANEIKRSLNGNPLIFLNACSSGKNISSDECYLSTGEDSVGLTSSFIIGGAKGVISTLWNIKDNQAKEFAINFYKNFLSGKNIGASILKSKIHTHKLDPKDITWASFVYYGDPNLTIKN